MCECIMILQWVLCGRNRNCEFAPWGNYKYTNEKMNQYSWHLPAKVPSKQMKSANASYDIAVGCSAEEMGFVSLLHGAIINTPMKRGINIHDTYSLKYHQNENCECIIWYCSCGCSAEEMGFVSLLHGAIINTPKKRGINIPDTYGLKYH